MKVAVRRGVGARVDMASLDCEKVSPPVHSPFPSASCHLFPRQQRYKLQKKEEKKGARGKSAHCTVAEQTFKGLLPGMRGGGGGWWRWCRGNCWGRKAAAWCGSGSLQTEERPFPLPFSLSFSLFIHPPPLSIWCSGGETASISSWPASQRKTLSVAFCAASAPSARTPPCAAQVLINCHHLPHFSRPPPRHETHTHWHKAPVLSSAITRTIAEPQEWEMGRQRERANGWRNEWLGVWADEENKWQRTLLHLVSDWQVETVCQWNNLSALKGKSSILF